jgi:ribosomal protein L32
MKWLKRLKCYLSPKGHDFVEEADPYEAILPELKRGYFYNQMFQHLKCANCGEWKLTNKLKQKQEQKRKESIRFYQGQRWDE